MVRVDDGNQQEPIVRACGSRLSLTVHLNEFRFIGNLVEEENPEPCHATKSHKKKHC